MIPALLGSLLAACDGGSPVEGTGGEGGGTTTETGGAATTTTETVDPLGPWVFEPVTIEGLAPVWGGIVAQESPQIAYLAGGVGGTTGPVTGDLVRVEQGKDGVTATTVSSQLTDRYCGCAMIDPKRQELVVVGGRNASFQDLKTAEIVDLSTGAVTPLDAGEAAAHPVGCHAVFLPDRDEGYVFGGAGQGAGFSAGLWRYTPEDHLLTPVDGAAGPPARYDGALRYPVEGGPVWLVGGMGLAGSLKFYSDVWKLDPATGVWTEVAVTGATPPGRRLPWVAFSGDGSQLVMGFGSDSAMGQTMLGDLWRLDLAAGTWSEVPRTDDVQPADRGFATWLPGPEGSAGLLHGGLEELGITQQAFVLRPPVTTGDWR